MGRSSLLSTILRFEQHSSNRPPQCKPKRAGCITEQRETGRNALRQPVYQTAALSLSSRTSSLDMTGSWNGLCIFGRSYTGGGWTLA